MSYYKQIAEMLRLELNEEFRLKSKDGELLSKNYRISPTAGLLLKCSDGWRQSGYIDEIISGRLTVVKLPWKPKNGEHYYVYSTYHKTVIETIWLNVTEDLLYWNIGNCFKTREEAETKGKEIMEKIEKEYKES